MTLPRLAVGAIVVVILALGLAYCTGHARLHGEPPSHQQQIIRSLPR